MIMLIPTSNMNEAKITNTLDTDTKHNSAQGIYSAISREFRIERKTQRERKSPRKESTGRD
jgi:hypothetical protein